jgi:hypothetical protein
MALLEDMFKGNVMTGLAVGVGAAVLAPVLVPAIGGALRPVAKEVIKLGLMVYDKGREAAANVGEMTEDIAAEARSEMAHRTSAASPPATEGATG